MRNIICNGILTSMLVGSLFAGPVAAKTTVIDILGVYSADIDTNGNDPEARFVSMLEYTNTALRNSQANLQFRLVHVEKIDIPNDGKTDDPALESVRRNKGVKKLRKQHGADIVSLMTVTGPYCGIAYVGEGKNDKLVSNTTRYAYSVVGYSCTSSFGHELGHNLGLDHSLRQGDEGGLHPWGRGYGVDGLFATIMTYASAFATSEIPYFSNPNISECRGQPCGVDRNAHDGADAVHSLSVAAPQYAAFLPAADGSDQGPNLLNNGDFETLDGWSVFLDNGQISLSPDKVSGNYSALITNRTHRSSGPVTQIQQQLEPDTTYKFSTWIKLGDGEKHRQPAKAYLYAVDAKGKGHRYPLGRINAVKGQWNRLAGSFSTKNRTFTDVSLRVEGPKPGYDLLVDDMRFTKSGVAGSINLVQQP